MKHLLDSAMKEGLSLDASLAILDQLPFAVLIKDESLRFRLMNRAFAAIINRKAEDLIGLSAKSVDPQRAPLFERRERSVLQTGRARVFQESLLSQNGELHDYQTRINRIVAETGESYICLTLTDVTDFNQARAQAVESDRRKSEFLANTSHEIRTPLNGILGMTELLLQSDLPDKQRAMIEVVKNSGGQLMRVINDVLDVSHIEAGEVKLAPTHFMLEDVLDEVAALLSSKAAEKGIDLHAHIRPEAPRRLFLDDGRLRQILINLIGNAIKFTDAGYVLVDVTAENGYLEICVEDTGMGVPDHKKDKIFQKFIRSDLTDGKERGGAGLGLSICASLVKLLGGSIGVETAQGGGARFSFHLPIEQAEPVADITDVSIAVVDSNPLRADIVADRLRRWGYRPLLAPFDGIEESDVKAIIFGPGARTSDIKVAAPDAHLISLTPFGAVRTDSLQGGAIHEESLPLNGAKLSRKLAELIG